MKRAVGYCEQHQCAEYMKGVFLMNHGEIFICPACRNKGVIESERGEGRGQSNRWKEVRVEFNYDPIHKKYRALAILTDTALKGDHNVYTLKSPLIKTEKRALKLAESFLATLQNQPPLEGVHYELLRSDAKVLSFDEPDINKFKRDLTAISKAWEGLSYDQ